MVPTYTNTYVFSFSLTKAFAYEPSPRPWGSSPWSWLHFWRLSCCAENEDH